MSEGVCSDPHAELEGRRMTRGCRSCHIADQDGEIEQLRATLAEKDAEIASLRALLEHASSNEYVTGLQTAAREEERERVLTEVAVYGFVGETIANHIRARGDRERP